MSINPDHTPNIPATDLSSSSIISAKDLFAHSPLNIPPFSIKDDSWDEVLASIRKNALGPVPGREKVIYIGDIHGASPNILDEDLRRVGFLDANRRWQNPQNRKLVQVGDLIDRGEHGLAIYDRLADLQEQSKTQLIRLFGNHELYHLAGVAWQIGATKIPGLQERLFRDILSHKVLAAFLEGNTIYTHAGIDLKFFPEFVNIESSVIVSEINRRFFSAVERFHKGWVAAKNDPDIIYPLIKSFLASDKIFDSENGIFWTRSKIANDQFQQVVGHTPQRNGIKDNPGDRVKYIDAGRIFGELGNFGLLNSRAFGANSANSASMRTLAHDLTPFADFLRKGGKAFTNTSWSKKVLEIFANAETQEIKLTAAHSVDARELCSALEKLEEQQPEAVKIFVLKYFCQISSNKLQGKFSHLNENQIYDLWKTTCAWLYYELFPRKTF